MLSWDHKSRINDHIERVACKMGGGGEIFASKSLEEKQALRKSAEQAVLPEYILKCNSFELLREFMAAIVAGDFNGKYAYT